MSDWPNDTFLSARNIRRACDASLRRLQTDYIDLYQMHHVDRKTPWDEIWQAMDTLVAAGQDPLRRLVELRRLAPREGPGSGEPPSFHRPRERAVALQPDGAHGRARGAARRARLRHRRHPVVARCTAACSAASCASRSSAGRRAGARRPASRSTATGSRSTRSSATSSATSLPTSRSPGCCTSPR